VFNSRPRQSNMSMTSF